MRSSRIPVSFVLSLLWVISTNAAPVKGVVIDPGGAAVSGCRVTAYALEGTEAQVLRYESDKPDRKSLASATSNAAGEFSIDVPAERVFQLQFEAEKFAPAATPVANGEDIGAVLLTPAPTKVGSLRAKGKPVAGARVIYIGAAEMITVTDTEGKFRVADPGLW
ncbi:MAG TPA: carboxypeptidase-like regulatory domain-containing protein, partial [Thermoanaerobaculia bacterium]|nr:carboxypeptidase-like regulatory domain-containing protein [Thermoanaerobaculia bacterium]